MPRMAWQGKTAVVTGASRGIGRAVAERLVDAGVGCVLVARSASDLEELSARLRSRSVPVWSLPWDLSRPESMADLAQGIYSLHPTIDILIHSAGIAHSAPFPKQTLEVWRNLFAVNVESPFFLTQALLPGMLERRWGRVIAIASIAARTADRYISAYAASKHALLGWTRSLAVEVAPFRVTVNALCPGYVDTPMIEQSISRIVQQTGRSAEEVRSRLVALNPQGRIIQSQEVAYWVLALLSDEAAAVNGQALGIDGGALRA